MRADYIKISPNGVQMSLYNVIPAKGQVPLDEWHAKWHICPLFIIVAKSTKPHVSSGTYSRMGCGYVTLKSHLFPAHSQGKSSLAHTNTHKHT